MLASRAGPSAPGRSKLTDAALEERIAAEDLATAVVDEDDVSGRMAKETHPSSCRRSG